MDKVEKELALEDIATIIHLWVSPCRCAKASICILFNNGNTKVFTKKALKKKTPAPLPAMEENLDMPLKQAISIMQHQIKKYTTYFGVRAIKNPLDFWVYREILFGVKPDVVIEIGNRYGGSTLAIAHILDILQKGRVIGIDIDQSQVPRVVRKHNRITLIKGDACDSIDKVRQLMNKGDRVLIIEDSAHTYENTLNVLRTFAPLVTPGSFFIVEDSIIHHGVDEGPYPGPYEAIEEFLKDNDSFEIDRTKESFFITHNPKGFLARIK